MSEQRTPLTGTQATAWVLVLLTGLIFWNILGLPFQHHNESFIWAVHLHQGTFVECVTEKMVTVANHRPLGQAMAWLTFVLSGDSVVPSQIFNLTVAVAAWVLMFLLVRQRRVFSLVGLVVGGVLFAGYIYIFHLHGVFYSAVLLMLVALLALFEYGEAPRRIGLATLCALAAAMFHPYALLLFIAGAAGAAIRGWTFLPRRTIAALGAGIAVATLAIIVLVILPGDTIPATFEQRWDGFVTSYRATEVHPLISVVAALLALVTAMSTGGGSRPRAIVLTVTMASLAALSAAGLPLIWSWIVAGTMKMIAHRRWSLAGMIGAAALLPSIAPSGSPTYSIYLFMLLSVALSWDWESAERRLAGVHPAALFAVGVAAVLIGVALRAGASLPVLSRFAHPILAERERTEQLMTIIEWWHSSPYEGLPIGLAQEAVNPVDMPDVADRRFRPPTSRRYLARYLTFTYGPPAEGDYRAPVLHIVFGGAPFERGTVVYEVPGMFSGSARVVSTADALPEVRKPDAPSARDGQPAPGGPRRSARQEHS